MTAWSLKGRNDFLQRLAALAAVPIVAVSLMAGSVSAAAQDEVGLDAALADSDSPPLEPKPQDLESVEGGRGGARAGGAGIYCWYLRHRRCDGHNHGIGQPEMR